MEKKKYSSLLTTVHVNSHSPKLQIIFDTDKLAWLTMSTLFLNKLLQLFVMLLQTFTMNTALHQCELHIHTVSLHENLEERML